jgi:hypothetical protein
VLRTSCTAVWNPRNGWLKKGETADVAIVADKQFSELQEHGKLVYAALQIIDQRPQLIIG